MFSACHSKMERESRRVKKSDEPSLTCFNYLPLVERRVGSVGIIWSSPYAASDTAKSSGALSGPCLRDRTLCRLLGWSPLRNSDYDGWVLSVRSNDEIDTFYDLCSPYLVVKKISFLPSFTTVMSLSVLYRHEILPPQTMPKSFRSYVLTLFQCTAGYTCQSLSPTHFTC